MPAGTSETKPPPPSEHPGDIQRGILLVATCAIIWSSGGLIARFLRVDDNWTMVFWHSLFAAAFLLTFMLARDGPKGPLALLRGMGRAGIGVALCFAVASPMFIVALAYTTVANMLLMQAGVPLIAARLAWIRPARSRSVKGSDGRRAYNAGRRGHSSVGRAPGLHPGGRRFEPGWLHPFSVVYADPPSGFTRGYWSTRLAPRFGTVMATREPL